MDNHAVQTAISADHAQRAIGSCNPLTAVGLRDRAVLLLPRLGLRACQNHQAEFGRHRLGPCATVHLRQGRTASLLPMPTDRAAVAVSAIRSTACRIRLLAIFLRSIALIRGLLDGSDGVGSIVRYAPGAYKGRHRIVARINSDMPWRATCCGKGHRCPRSERCCATAARRPPASMPR